MQILIHYDVNNNKNNNSVKMKIPGQMLNKIGCWNNRYKFCSGQIGVLSNYSCPPKTKL